MKNYKYSFQTFGLVMSEIDVIELNRIFDINKIYQGEVEHDLFGNLLPPKKCIYYTEFKNECPDCDGSGEVEISDYVGSHWYYENVECQNCDGTGFIIKKTIVDYDKNNPDIIQDIEPIEFICNGYKFKFSYNEALLLFIAHGKKCAFDKDSIIFNERLSYETRV